MSEINLLKIEKLGRHDVFQFLQGDAVDDDGNELDVCEIEIRGSDSKWKSDTDILLRVMSNGTCAISSCKCLPVRNFESSLASYVRLSEYVNMVRNLDPR